MDTLSLFTLSIHTFWKFSKHRLGVYKYERVFVHIKLSCKQILGTSQSLSSQLRKLPLTLTLASKERHLSP